MKTDKKYEQDIKTSRRKLFYVLYTLPWLLLVSLLVGIIVFQYTQNDLLRKRNNYLSERNEHLRKNMSVVLPLHPRNDVARNVEQPRSLELEEIERSEQSGGSGDSEEFVEPITFETNEPNIPQTINDELIELYLLRKQLDNIDNNHRSERNWEDIRRDFSMIRRKGFTQENYNYAEQMGIRLEVQLIRRIEATLDKVFLRNNIDFENEAAYKELMRELKYEINSVILNNFRVFWNLN